MSKWRLKALDPQTKLQANRKRRNLTGVLSAAR